MKKLLAIAMVIIVSGVFSGCGRMDLTEKMKQEYETVGSQAQKFQETQPAPTITYSSTRGAVSKRIIRWSDPNKISYIYLVNYGRVMAFYTVKGSVESKRSYLFPITAPFGNSGAVVDTPDIDGTYGDNADSIFFFTVDDVYVEWHGDYMWVDQPLKLATQPELIYVAPLK